MHQSPASSAVLFLSIPPGVDAAGAGCEISELPGVAAVTAYPERGQLLVRYAPSEIDPHEIRACLLPESSSGGVSGSLLAAWPRVAEVLPIAAAWL